MNLVSQARRRIELELLCANFINNTVSPDNPSLQQTSGHTRLYYEVYVWEYYDKCSIYMC